MTLCVTGGIGSNKLVITKFLTKTRGANNKKI